MFKKWFVLVLTLVLIGQVPLRAEEEHNGNKNSKEESGRPSAEKKSSTLADKISACLKSRPASSKNTEAAPTTPSEKGPVAEESSSTHSAPQTGADGEALFTKHCSSCHSLDKLNLSDAADAVGVSMPKGNPSSVPPQEVAALKQFFLSKVK